MKLDLKKFKDWMLVEVIKTESSLSQCKNGIVEKVLEYDSTFETDSIWLPVQDVEDTRIFKHHIITSIGLIEQCDEPVGTLEHYSAGTVQWSAIYSGGRFTSIDTAPKDEIYTISSSRYKIRVNGRMLGFYETQMLLAWG